MEPATEASTRAPSRIRAPRASLLGQRPIVEHPDEGDLRADRLHDGPQVGPPPHVALAGHGADLIAPAHDQHLGRGVHLPLDGRQAGVGQRGVFGDHDRRHRRARWERGEEGSVVIELANSAAPLREGQSLRTVTLLSGGVGGARMARGLAAVPGLHDPTIVVNVGDDEEMYGVHVSPDLDTVMYTLAGIEGPHGWGIADDTFTIMDRMASLGTDTTFRLGDKDLSTNLIRTAALADGRAPLRDHGPPRRGIRHRCPPAPRHRRPAAHRHRHRRRRAPLVPGVLRVARPSGRGGGRHYEGAESAAPAPGVIEAIESAPTSW